MLVLHSALQIIRKFQKASGGCAQADLDKAADRSGVLAVEHYVGLQHDVLEAVVRRVSQATGRPVLLCRRNSTG